jgi:septum formation protein
MILASASPRRYELLSECGLDVRVLPADIDETRLDGETPVDLVRRLAEGKAHEAARAYGKPLDDALVAADTIVWDDGGDVLGKPADKSDATRMLQVLSGVTHHVSTGVCVMVPSEQGAHESSFVETTDVTFRELTEAEIKAYVDSGEPMDKAGAYGIQGLGRLLVSRIKGDYPNVVGLPVMRTLQEIDRLNDNEALVIAALGGKHA